MYPSRSQFTLLMLNVLAVPLAAQAAPHYAYTATGLTPDKSFGLSISNSGKITGRATLADRAFLFSHDGVTDLGTLPGDTSSLGYGVNNAGHVVGISIGPDSRRAFLYANGAMTDLGSLDNSFAEASGINEAGRVVGTSGVGQFTRAFLYQDGVMSSLGTLPGASSSFGTAINNSGQMTGGAAYLPYDPYGSNSTHAFLYEDGVMKDLGSLGGPSSVGYGINELGHVVGMSMTIPDNYNVHRPFLHDGTTMRDLGTPLPTDYIRAQGINNLGQVVGLYSVGRGRAFLYGPRIGMRDLSAMVDPASGWYIHAAYSINDRQQIVGLGCKDGKYGAVLLNPTHRDGLVAAGAGAAAGAGTSTLELEIGAPENPQCPFG